jgi:hypothetical protein
MSTSTNVAQSQGDTSTSMEVCPNFECSPENMRSLADLIFISEVVQEMMRSSKKHCVDDTKKRDWDKLFDNNTFSSFSSKPFSPKRAKSAKSDCICCMDSCKTFMTCCQVAVCKDCFKKWTRENPTCPHCRVEIDK